MNYKIPKISKERVTKAIKCLAVVGALFLGAAFFFNSDRSLATLQACTGAAGEKPGTTCLLPNCASLTTSNSINGSDVPLPGVNCFYLDLPPCTGNGAVSGAISPRINCADLADMPLCTQVNSASNAKNCTNLCDPDPATDSPLTGHNVTCARFCDSVKSGVTPVPRTTGTKGNCVARQCQQVDTAAQLTSSNCTKLACNLLTTDELDESRMQNENDPDFAQYCDGSSVKCHNFSAAQLPYARFRYNNTMCQIHSCKPISPSCGRDVVGKDDTLNISNNNTSLTFSDGTSRSYPTLYSTYINLGLPLTDTSICSPVVCKPIVYTPYYCGSPVAPPKDSNGNLLCDTTGDGSTCATTDCVSGQVCLKNKGYCYKTIDCNDPKNASLTQCAPASPSGSQDNENLTDDTESWFYRPSPPNKAYIKDDPAQGYRISGMCYSKSDLKKQSDDSSDDHKWGSNPVIDLSTPLCPTCKIPLGYFHAQWGPFDKTRSPQLCKHYDGDSKSVLQNGWRGTGYSNMCGNNDDISQKIKSHTAYYKGYVQTQFLDNSDTSSTINVCLRFKNAIRTNDATMPDSETCGSRECAINCAFGVCTGQMCGYEVCKDLTVKYSNSKECAFDDDLFQNTNVGRGCLTTIDQNLRIRAVQYGHQICAFVDVNGLFAYSDMFLDADQKLDNGISCISGSYNSTTGKCDGGKDSNDDKTLANRWRAILKVVYSQGNLDGFDPVTRAPVKGFYTKSGKFIPAQECVKIPLRTSPPDMYNLATANNSLKLFTPPLYIRNANTVKGGTSASDANSLLGTTDFLKPEIVVQFGTSTRTFSLDTQYNGYEVTKDPNSYAFDGSAMTTIMNGITYKAEVLIKKDLEPTTNQPLVCLYNRLSSNSGFTDVKIGCANRSLPELNNTDTSSAAKVGARKSVVSGSTSDATTLSNDGNYGNSNILLKYCDSANCSSLDASTNPIPAGSLSITNADSSTPTCAGVNEDGAEKYQVCAQRESCSQLWKECMENEIRIQNGVTNSTLDSIRANCKNLASNCNAKKGIASSSAALIDQVNSTAADPAAYGWFNELCIVSGFESKLKQVYNQAVSSSTLGIGKCLLSVGNAQSCYASGSAEKWKGDSPTCRCATFDPNTAVAGYDSSSRAQTPREAGLCIDIPTPKVCQGVDYGKDHYGGISYGQSTESNPNSLNGTAYSPAGTVDLHHSYRANQRINASDTALNAGHAEFPSAVVGMNGVSGSCNGFWKSATDSAGSSLTPKMSCSDNPNSATTGTWNSLISTSSACVRYSCSAVTTGGSVDVNGNYSNPNYNISSETSDSINETAPAAGQTFGITYNDVTLGTKGQSKGYATWLALTKTNDFTQLNTLSANAVCIPGFAGTPPTRTCGQLGSWNPVSGACVRKTCSAINPPYSSTPSPSTTSWSAWSASGGATFGVEVDVATGEPLANGSRTHVTPASRSASIVTVGSTRKGYCNNKLGYFTPLGGKQPEADCLSDGTWSAIRNKCVTSCTAITTPGSADGKATWPAITGVPISGICSSNSDCQSPSPSLVRCVNGTCVASGTCVSGYSNYPYAHYNDNTGAPLTPTSNPSTSSNPPYRTCQNSLWTNTSSTCVNQCPGYDTDSRIGVGITSHPTSKGSINIKWDAASLGATAVKTVGFTSSGSTVGLDGQEGVYTASDYASSSDSDGRFIVTRKCGAGYAWEAPVVQCAANSGGAVDALNGTNTANISSASRYLASGASVQASSCIFNYNSTPLPSYTCTAPASGNIDQYYYARNSGSNQCAQVTCSLKSGDQASSNSTYSGSTTTLVGGSSPVTLSCKSGYGHADATAQNPGSDDTCGISVNDRMAAAPTIQCINDNGVGKLVITNDCTTCRNCSNTSNLKEYSAGSFACRADAYQITDCYSINGGKCNPSANKNQVFNKALNTKNHLSFDSWCQSQHHNRDSSGIFKLKCVDGIYVVKSACGRGTGYGDNENNWLSTGCSTSAIADW